MNITIAEAAEALGVCANTVVRWYLSSYTASKPSYYTVESEALCHILGLDHRYLLAWLNGYDIGLTRAQVCIQLNKNPRWLNRPRKITPVVRFVTHPTAEGRSVFERYSQRDLLPHLPIMKERQNAKRLQIFGGLGIGPSPSNLTATDRRLDFHSKCETEGKGLPSTLWLRNRTPDPESSLVPGIVSSLPRYWPYVEPVLDD